MKGGQQHNAAPESDTKEIVRDQPALLNQTVFMKKLKAD